MGIENNRDNITDLNSFRERKEIDRQLNQSFMERTYSPDAVRRISEQLAVYAEQAAKVAHLLKALEEEGKDISEDTYAKINKLYELLDHPEFTEVINQYLPWTMGPVWSSILAEVGADRVREIMASYDPLYKPVGKG